MTTFQHYNNVSVPKKIHKLYSTATVRSLLKKKLRWTTALLNCSTDTGLKQTAGHYWASGDITRSVSDFSRQLIMMSDICGCQNLPGAERGGRASTPRECRHISPETGIRLPPTSAWYHFCTAKTMSWILKMSPLATSLHLTFHSNICFFQWIRFIVSPQPPKAGGCLQKLVCLNIAKWHWNDQN